MGAIERIGRELSGIRQETPFEFSKHSSIGIGGRGKLALYPATIEEMQQTVDCLRRSAIDYAVVGNMSNVLPPDDPAEKIIVCTKLLVGAQLGESTFVLAGTNVGTLLRSCRYADKSGAEFLIGIPGTIGGALYMNAGVRDRHMSDITESVLVFRNGALETIPLEACGYAYKRSVFMENEDVILGATLRLTDSSKIRIEELQKLYRKRRAHLPNGKSMGCVFKNPEGMFAGVLIEEAGLKGATQGAAFVSSEHANFIINGGSATECDVRLLIDRVKERVYSKFGVRLEEEIRYLT